MIDLHIGNRIVPPSGGFTQIKYIPTFMDKVEKATTLIASGFTLGVFVLGFILIKAWESPIFWVCFLAPMMFSFIVGMAGKVK